MNNMRNIFLFLILLHPDQLFAQNQAFGLRTGVNVSKVTVTNLDSKLPFYNPLPAYHFSGLIRTELRNKLDLQTELSYSVKGLKDNNPDKFTEKFHYLTLPVIIQYNLNKNLSVEAGLEPSYLLNYKQCVPLVERKWDLCADLGLAFRLSSVFSLGLRFNHGLIPITTLDIRDSQGRNLKMARYGNRTLQVSLSYLLLKTD